jgi:hypothetical protein
MAYTRVRKCSVCGIEQTIRKDSKSETCKKCSGKKSGEKNKKIFESLRNDKKKECLHCKNLFYNKEKTAIFCSKECCYEHKRIERECKNCHAKFKTQKGKISGLTNSRANFCSLNCYRQFQGDGCGGYRGNDWYKLSKRYREIHRFCTYCGTFKNIQVHHIVPYRINMDNSISNLHVLCSSCHKKVENWTNEFINSGIDIQTMKVLLRVSFLSRRLMTAHMLKEVRREINANSLQTS